MFKLALGIFQRHADGLEMSLADYIADGADMADPCFNMTFDPAQQQCFPHLMPFFQPDPVNAYEACG